MNLLKKIQPIYIFLTSVALFRLPYLYIIPGIKSEFLTSQSLARILLGIAFIWGLYAKRGLKFVSKQSKLINITLLAFFLISSLSVIYAINMDAFLNRYKDFLVGIVAFYTFYLFKEHEKKIAITLLITIPIMIIYQFILLSDNFLSQLLQQLIYQRHYDIVIYNLERNRIYVDVFDEAFIPLLFVVFQSFQGLKRFIFYPSAIVISYLAFISNFRTRLLMLVLGFVGLIFVQNRNRLKSIIILGALVLSVGFFVSSTAGLLNSYSFYDRLLFSDEIEDVESITSRYDQIQTTLYIGTISPLGAGLGNFYDNLPVAEKDFSQSAPPAEVSAKEYVHNNLATVIAESGYIAFALFAFLLIQFAVADIKTLTTKDGYKKAFVFAFWSLFLYGFFNPPIPVSYQVLFWGMRGLLLK